MERKVDGSVWGDPFWAIESGGGGAGTDLCDVWARLGWTTTATRALDLGRDD